MNRKAKTSITPAEGGSVPAAKPRRLKGFRAALAMPMIAAGLIAGATAAAAEPPSGGDNYDSLAACSPSGGSPVVNGTANYDDYSTTTHSGTLDYIVLRSPVRLQRDTGATFWQSHRTNGTYQTGGVWVETHPAGQPWTYRVDPDITKVDSLVVYAAQSPSGPFLCSMALDAIDAI